MGGEMSGLEICSTWLCTNPESSNQYRNYEN